MSKLIDISKCRKCGHNDISIKFYKEIKEGDPTFLGRKQEPRGEILWCECKRCEYIWESPTLDNKGSDK